MTNNVPAYIVVECRPSTEEDNYADINIGDDSYIFCSIEPVMDTGNWQKNIQAAILIGIDIERTRPEHKHITLHAESILKLCKGIQGKPINA
ncbi:hypothetical protein HN264_08140 [Acinetobacter baumannii]|uniref:hypothetical protein n=1 Tax=Acinetobacter baumannii TaxID=470 RepID=UPI00146F3ABD|nr:hypothetical protein [Acinetobacter baumannii]MBF6697294.1 hypothetical protein [Acinetobacter baumannii]MBF6710928.1 hypothetical protein [Acinetobacter baumannii]MBF6758761.1 hypothetical protein [Acinetobacter baumannii]MBF6831023.1 hypothetical protein [Acinetobacter baumannii]MBF6836071.1 hypothetical protein [Acinetobacter baumannii]